MIQAGGIFEGIKVADFAWAAVGPQAARELAEYGATVVHVESHKRPDTMRVTGPYKDGITGIDRSAFFAMYNTNKYGISLDLSKPKGREVARRLVAWADVVTESMTPGSMAKLELDYESCRGIKPDIIYLSTCQMGQKGPYNGLGGYGTMGAAYAGLAQCTGWPDRTPVHLPNTYTDYIAGWYLTSVVIAGLDYRRRTGKGLYVDQSQIEDGITFWGPGLLDYIVNGRIVTRMGNRDANMVPHGAFPCLGDDKWVAIAVASDAEWKALCRAIGSPKWGEEPRFATLLQRKANEDELEPLIAEWCKDYSPEEVMVMLQDAGVPAGVVSTGQDLFEDPQLRYRGHFVPLRHRVMDIQHYHMPAYRLSKTPAHLYRAAPCLGQDNEFVYKDILGYTDDDIAKFLIDGVVTTEHDIPDILKPQKPK